MKQMLLAIFSALCFAANAQITVNNSYFPSSGDTVRTARMEDPDDSFDALIRPPGGPYVWDFSNAVTDGTSTTVYQSASAGANVALFSGADLVVIGEAGETYFDKTADQFIALGYAGTDPGGFGLSVVAKFSPAVVERKAPLNFFDIQVNTTDLSLPFSTAQLPDSLFEGVPISIDSIRVRLNTQRVEACDAYGSVKLPSGTEYDVLRVRRTEYTTTNLDVKVPFLGWVDISTLLGGGGGGGGLTDFLGTDTTVTHRFFANDVPQEVAILTLNNSGNEIDDIRFKTETTSSVISDWFDAPGAASVSAFPNPAIDYVRFDCFNLPNDEYTLKIYNIVGKQVHRETHQLVGNKSIRLDLNNFRKGTYLYSLVNKKGDVIGTKRLVIAKP
jgi:hypothetical protein